MYINNSPKRLASCHPDEPHAAKGLCRKCYINQYVGLNREEHNRRSRDYYKLNREKVLERARLKRPIPKYSRKETLLDRLKIRAAQKGLEFNLVLEDLKIPHKCPVLGIPLKFGKKSGADCSPSVDRIDNSKGYTKDNIVIISHRANRIKTDATVEELQKLATFYSKYSKR